MNCAGTPDTLSEHLGLELAELWNVLELEEDVSYARLRIVARASPTQVLWQLGAALGEAWVRQPARASGRETPSGLMRPLRTTVHRAHYLNETSSEFLHVTVQPIGRSNLFRLELRLAPLKDAR